MKVIKKGRAQKGWSIETTCTGLGNGMGGCGAKLLVETGDLYQTKAEHYDGSTDYYVTFECVQCGVETDLKDVPSAVTQKMAPNKTAWKKRKKNESL